MPRTPLDPQKRLLTVAVRLEPEYVDAVDLVAYGLSARAGRKVKRSAALRFILSPVLAAIVARADLLEAIRITRRDAVGLAEDAVGHRNDLERVGPIIRAFEASTAKEIPAVERRVKTVPLPPRKRAGKNQGSRPQRTGGSGSRAPGGSPARTKGRSRKKPRDGEGRTR